MRAFSDRGWKRVEKVTLQITEVAFSTFSLWLEKGIKKADKSSQNGYPGPKAVVREVAESDKWLCLLEFRECRRFSPKKWKTVDLHKTLAGIVQTHHRPSWKILFWLPEKHFSQIGDAIAMRHGSQRRRNHQKSQKTRSRRGLRPTHPPREVQGGQQTSKKMPKSPQ